MKTVLVWDVGRPGKGRAPRVLEWLLGRRPELVVLAKCRHASLPLLAEAFEDAGYAVLLGAASLQPSLFMASLEPARAEDWPAPQGYEHRWTPFKLEPSIDVLAVHIPYAAEEQGVEGKRRYWDAVIDWCAAHQNGRAMVLGTFNTGLPADTQGERYTLGEYIQELLNRGWVDCWRHANPGVDDFGWFSHTGNGFRLDHCFFSPALAPDLRDGEFDHLVRFEGLSSSAPLIVCLESATGAEHSSGPRPLVDRLRTGP